MVAKMQMNTFSKLRLKMMKLIMIMFLSHKLSSKGNNNNRMITFQSSLLHLENQAQTKKLMNMATKKILMKKFKDFRSKMLLLHKSKMLTKTMMKDLFLRKKINDSKPLFKKVRCLRTKL